MTCSMLAGTDAWSGKTTSSQAVQVVAGGMVTDADPAPGLVVPSASCPPATGVRSARPVLPGTSAWVAASCSSMRSMREGTGVAAGLLAPYAAWTAYATALNSAIVARSPGA